MKRFRRWFKSLERPAQATLVGTLVAAVLGGLIGGFFLISNTILSAAINGGGSPKEPSSSAEAGTFQADVSLPPGYYVTFSTGAIGNDNSNVHQDVGYIAAKPGFNDGKLFTKNSDFDGSGIIMPASESPDQDSCVAILRNAHATSKGPGRYIVLQSFGAHAWFCVKTSDGNIAALQVMAVPSTEQQPIRIHYILWK